jgi:hypothetical protein
MQLSHDPLPTAYRLPPTAYCKGERMAERRALDAIRARLERVDYGEHGVTRNDLRAQIPDLPEAIYLHLPDSKRLRSADEVLHEVRSSAWRAEGEFVGPDDLIPSEGAEADYGPAAYGDSPLVSLGAVGPTTNTPLPGFDGNSLETEQEYSEG